MKSFSLQQIVDANLCSGCGACAGVAPEQIKMVDVMDSGLRPEAVEGSLSDDGARRAARVCPGAGLSHRFDRNDPAFIPELIDGWGPVVGLWEGHATSSDVRRAASSGGAVTALARFLLEQEDCDGVVHTAAHSEKPWLNQTVYSRSGTELDARSGSRYAPASPAEGIPLMKRAKRASVFVGKPCDVAALLKARQLDPDLESKTKVTIAIFCAGTPSTAGTLAMLKKMDIAPDHRLQSLSYRGDGWPGKATAVQSSGEQSSRKVEMTYAESWGGILTKHVQWRCRVCADHTGEFADISIGDPWYRTPAPGEEGDSLIVARTPLGKQMVEAAIAADYLSAKEAEPWVLPASQPNLLKTRGAIWGRTWASRMMLRGAPRYERMPTFRFWLSELSFTAKAQSFVGTWRRLFRHHRTSRGA